jgi:hypothetical protein
MSSAKNELKAKVEEVSLAFMYVVKELEKEGGGRKLIEQTKTSTSLVFKAVVGILAPLHFRDQTQDTRLLRESLNQQSLETFFGYAKLFIHESGKKGKRRLSI